ncbi:hypothetical protein F5Y15DRAFT_413078 [Xylariaceae sp. FL0016]|nr:hypothetical protein F5Y15DRAFT_413078 [Xylariaceae sp. FL0016]
MVGLINFLRLILPFLTTKAHATAFANGANLDTSTLSLAYMKQFLSDEAGHVVANGTGVPEIKVVQVIRIAEISKYDGNDTAMSRGNITSTHASTASATDSSLSVVDHETYEGVRNIISWAKQSNRVSPRKTNHHFYGRVVMDVCDCKWPWYVGVPEHEVWDFMYHAYSSCDDRQSGCVLDENADISQLLP